MAAVIIHLLTSTQTITIKKLQNAKNRQVVWFACINSSQQNGLIGYIQTGSGTVLACIAVNTSYLYTSIYISPRIDPSPNMSIDLVRFLFLIHMSDCLSIQLLLYLPTYQHNHAYLYQSAGLLFHPSTQTLVSFMNVSNKTPVSPPRRIPTSVSLLI